MTFPEEDRQGQWLIPAAVALSVLLHVAVFGGLSQVDQEPRRARTVEVDFVTPPPPPPPEPVVEPEPTPPPPKPKPKPVFREAKKVKEAPKPPPQELPASNRTKPLEEEPPAEPPKPVFGVTPESVAEGGEVAAPVGNTLMKPPDDEFTPPEEVKPYVQPEKAPFNPAPIIEVTSYPSVRSQVTPDYPPDLRAEGIEGTVIVEVDIDAEGNVVDCRLKRPTGLPFDEAALNAIRKTKYNPAKQGDKPVPVRVAVPVKFRLR